MRRINDGFPREPAPWRTKTGNHELLFVVNPAARRLRELKHAAMIAENEEKKARRERDAERWIKSLRATKKNAKTIPNGIRRA